MSEITAHPNQLTAWGTGLAAASCAHCQTSFLVACDNPPVKCPRCFQATLEITPGVPPPYLPELILPFQISEARIDSSIRSFASSIPFAPPGLNPVELRQRLATIYLPMWLVDGIVSAYWQAEVGFNYQVISYQETYNQSLGGWKSGEVKEPRVRWENRVGRLNRGYQNVASPALDDASELEKQLGPFHLDSAQSYSPECIRQAIIFLPDRAPDTCWSEAAAAFQKTAAQDCQSACSAGQIRQFRWKARYNHLNWTLLLLPMYSACYQDDHGEAHTITIHGQTGAISGTRRASGRRAIRAGAFIFAISIFLFYAGLLLDNIPVENLSLDMLAALLVVLGICGVLTACVPYVIAWDFNRRQKLEGRKN